AGGVRTVVSPVPRTYQSFAVSNVHAPGEPRPPAGLPPRHADPPAKPGHHSPLQLRLPGLSLFGARHASARPELGLPQCDTPAMVTRRFGRAPWSTHPGVYASPPLAPGSGLDGRHEPAQRCGTGGCTPAISGRAVDDLWPCAPGSRDPTPGFDHADHPRDL